MKLYTYALAPNPRRVGLMMKYKGIELETQEIDLAAKEQFSPEFSAVNPRLTLPSLVFDDGAIISDTIAICLYLDEVYPGASVFGQSSLERAHVIGWCHRIFFEGFSAVAEVLRNKGDAFKDSALPGPLKIPQIVELVERGNLRISAFFEAMNDEVSNRNYLVGDSLTQADIDLYVVLGFCGWVRRKIPENCPELQGWYDAKKAFFGE
ncbi:glutathione S-transferase family protein [Zhongshania sp.]|uniref:glutathione S-transferase family protein n=1 Tax=Zhongshania sp. TaxID=1971902 RepID=UPI001B51EC00|nr:glutathione S-transferase family protein [Zhongshania sp.]MBQ0796051.1 glutathione S-transferase family protein [Zhongshania sp.]